MSALDFPNAPTVGQIATLTNGFSYQWDGTAWVVGSSTGQVAGGDLTGTYPNPDIRALAVGTAELADGAVTAAKVLAGQGARRTWAATLPAVGWSLGTKNAWTVFATVTQTVSGGIVIAFVEPALQYQIAAGQTTANIVGMQLTIDGTTTYMRNYTPTMGAGTFLSPLPGFTAVTTPAAGSRIFAVQVYAENNSGIGLSQSVQGAISFIELL
jgi:hypothetical protein